MSGAHRPRRVLAEIKWSADPTAIAWVGSRTVHQYWPLLSGYFRDILLPPQRRADENAVAWTWREPGDGKVVSASELASVRKRLAADHQLFADNLTRGIGGDDTAGLHGQGNVEELGAAIQEMVAKLIARVDGELSCFVARTENGLRVHSWGALTAAELRYPDVREREISGQVLARGKAAPGHTVMLETSAGELVAESKTEVNGAFRFEKVAPGKYRLRAVSKTGGRFPQNGLSVTLENESLKGLILQEREIELAPAVSHAARGVRLAMAGAMAGVLVLGGAWFYRSHRTAQNRPVDNAGTIAELNSSHANAPKEQPIQVADEKFESSEKRSEPSKDGVRENAPSSSEEARVSRGEGSRTTLEKKIVQPASHSLPGSAPAGPLGTAAGLAGASGGPIQNGGGQNNSSPAQGQSAAVGMSEPARTLISSQASAPNGVVSQTTARSDAADTRARDFKSDFATMPSGVEKLAEKVPPATKETKSEVAALERKPPEMPPSRVPETDVMAASSLGPEPLSGERGLGDLHVSAESSEGMRATRRTLQVRRLPWRTRLLRDVILPTVPRRAGDKEPLAALRAELLAEHTARMPAEFHDGSVRSGLSFSMSHQDGELRWKHADLRATIDGHFAEFAFGAEAEDEGTAILVRGDGQVVAELRITPDNVFARIVDGVRVWQWFALAEGVRGAGSSENFVWRTASDAPLPDAWMSPKRSNSAELMARIRVPLDQATGNGVSQSLALVDEETGWALIGEARVEVAAELVETR